MPMSNYAKTMTRMTNIMSSNTQLMSGIRSPEGKYLYPMKNGPRGFTNLLGSQVIYNKLVENGIKNLFLSNDSHIISPVVSNILLVNTNPKPIIPINIITPNPIKIPIVTFKPVDIGCFFFIYFTFQF